MGPMDTQALVELEEAGWRALSDGTGAQFYDAFMADEGMMAIPFGLLDRDECVDAIAAAPSWDRYELSDTRVVVLSEDSAMVVYEARAERSGHSKYHALMSTTYVLRENEWLIAFHQQTPLVTEVGR
jgi:hypothetical protein